MARARSFPILIATDGSDDATACVTAATTFPWPAGTRAHAVVVRSRIPVSEVSGTLVAELEKSYVGVAEGARKILARRWPDAEVQIVDGAPVEAITQHAERLGARVVVLGSRGHGAIARLLVGSTSLGCLRRIEHAGLVVRGRTREVTRVAVGFDGSPSARHAVTLVASFQVPTDGHVTLIRATEGIVMTSLSRLPSAARAAIAREAAAAEAAADKKAQREMETAATQLRGAGWKVDIVLRRGAPLDQILAGAKSVRAHLLVLGARGQTPLERLILGSVAEGAIHRSPISVLITR